MLADKTIKCWGENSAGQLGIGTVDAVPHSTPALVVGINDATFVTGGSGGRFCAIVTGGAIKCWGGNTYGQIGNGVVGGNVPVPATVCQPGIAPCTPSSGATFVAIGDRHTCAAFAGGKVACWGYNQSGELGQPADALNHPLPTYVGGGLTATYLTAGNRITCAVSGGGVKCFGGNGSGRLGDGQDTGDQFVPTPVCTKQDCSTLLSNATAVATFDESTCAVAGGSVRCWGRNSGGQLGDGNASAQQNYAATQAIAAGAVAVTSAGAANYAIVVDGANRDLRCWGAEGSFQCGNGVDSKDRLTPISPKW